MLPSRAWLRGLLALSLLLCAAVPSTAGDIVPFDGGYRAGSIVIVTHQRRLYHVLGGGRAIRYPVGVGKEGMAWNGRARVAAKYLRPAWQKPPSLNGGHYGPVIPGGSPNNPMGAAVLGLSHGNYAIHGTNNPSTIGKFVSHGCIRMYNSDVLELYARTPIGTEVIVLP